MAFHESTMISGNKNGKFKSYHLSGHWKIESAISQGRKWGVMGEMTITYSVFDGSGHGRGGHDGKWKVDIDNNIKKIEEWQEGNRHKKA